MMPHHRQYGSIKRRTQILFPQNSCTKHKSFNWDLLWIEVRLTIGYIYSEFDTSICSLTVIPILRWFKLLPKFGDFGVIASKCEMGENGKLSMFVDYTT